jgi:hypothetical protein
MSAKKVDLRIDGNSVMQTVIREPITGGVGQILAASHDGARQLTERLKSKAPLVVEAYRWWLAEALAEAASRATTA